MVVQNLSPQYSKDILRYVTMRLNKIKINKEFEIPDKSYVLRYQYICLLLQRACSGIQGAQQTLRVRKRIEEKRSQALLGGGQKRIDAQHKKVRTNL